MKKLTLSLAALTLTALTAAPALADFIPYGNAGNTTPSVPITAAGPSINIYFYGSSAGDDDSIMVRDITQGWTSGAILFNHTTSVGTEFSLPTGANVMNAGDTLEFFLTDSSTGNTYSSIAGDSADGYNHAYLTPYSATGSTAVPGIPVGTFVGFEDLFIAANGNGVCGGAGNISDCDYNDDEFVFVGIQGQSATPEPSSLALLGTSILGMAGVVRRRFASR